MQPTPEENAHMKDVIEEVQQIMRDLVSGLTAKQPDEKIKEKTIRINEIKKEIADFKEKYPKCRTL